MLHFSGAISRCIVFQGDDDGVLASTGHGHNPTMFQLFADHPGGFPGVFLIPEPQLAVGAHAPAETLALGCDGERDSCTTGHVHAAPTVQGTEDLDGLDGVSLLLFSKTETPIFHATKGMNPPGRVKGQEVMLSGHDVSPAAAVGSCLRECLGLGQGEKYLALGNAKLKRNTVRVNFAAFYTMLQQVTHIPGCNY